MLLVELALRPVFQPEIELLDRCLTDTKRVLFDSRTTERGIGDRVPLLCRLSKGVLFSRLGFGRLVRVPGFVVVLTSSTFFGLRGERFCSVACYDTDDRYRDTVPRRLRSLAIYPGSGGHVRLTPLKSSLTTPSLGAFRQGVMVWTDDQPPTCVTTRGLIFSSIRRRCAYRCRRL